MAPEDVSVSVVDDDGCLGWIVLAGLVVVVTLVAIVLMAMNGMVVEALLSAILVLLIAWRIRNGLLYDRELRWEEGDLVESNRKSVIPSRRTWSRPQVAGVAWRRSGEIVLVRPGGGSDVVPWGTTEDQARNAAKWIAEGFGLTATCDDAEIAGAGSPGPAPGP